MTFKNIKIANAILIFLFSLIVTGCGDTVNGSGNLEESISMAVSENAMLQMDEALTPLSDEELYDSVGKIERNTEARDNYLNAPSIKTEDEVDPLKEDGEFIADIVIKIGKNSVKTMTPEEAARLEELEKIKANNAKGEEEYSEIDEYHEVDEGVDHTIGLVGKYGIDVSKYNKDIDWTLVKDSGVEYAIIRCGYRGYSSGTLVMDPYWVQNFNGARAAGLKVGVYFFTQAITVSEAIEEANAVVAMLQGEKTDYPIFLDVEGSSGRADGLAADVRTEIVSAFINEIHRLGYEAGVYANKKWYTQKLYPDQFPEGTYIWLAQYNVTEPTYNGSFNIWQYSSKGSVPGINGYVDVNQSFLSR